MSSFELHGQKPGEGVGMRREHAAAVPLTARPQDTSAHDPLGGPSPHVTSETAARDTLEQFGVQQRPDAPTPQVLRSLGAEPSAPEAAQTPAAFKPPVTLVGDGSAMATDERGRVFVVRQVGSLQRMRLSELVGAELSTNLGYINYGILATSVMSIDGESIVFNTKIQLEALVNRIDEAGFDAVREAFIALSKQTGNVKAAAKNS